MAALTADLFDHATHSANGWLEDIAARLGQGGPERAYRALRVVLHALRDRLGVNEATHLSAQLPLIVRGIFFDGWHPAGKPLRQNREEFLERVAQEFGRDPGTDLELVCRAVFETIEEHVTSGEAQKVMACLPADLRALWP
jgi:uncharacterized protein (DUF2267 family)